MTALLASLAPDVIRHADPLRRLRRDPRRFPLADRVPAKPNGARSSRSRMRTIRRNPRRTGGPRARRGGRRRTWWPASARLAALAEKTRALPQPRPVACQRYGIPARPWELGTGSWSRGGREQLAWRARIRRRCPWNTLRDADPTSSWSRRAQLSGWTARWPTRAWRRTPVGAAGVVAGGPPCRHGALN